MNLELKHLAPYLPYGLKYIVIKTNNIVELKAIDYGIKYVDFGWGDAKEMNEIKPILRPLSDLVKIIKVNGKAFIPIMVVFGGENYREYSYTIDLSERPILGKRIEISVEDLGSPCVTFFLNNVLNNLLTYHNWQLLLEWHFDVFGLIEQGIAIDINTLKS